LHIVLLEKEFEEAELFVEKFQSVFDSFTVTYFEHLGDFLMGYDDLPAIDLIITEDRLSLMAVRDDHDEWSAKLKEHLPEVVTDWKHDEAALRTLRHLRKSGLSMPMLVYTHSERDWLDAELLNDPWVTYCQKDSSWYVLLNTVRSILAVPV